MDRRTLLKLIGASAVTPKILAQIQEPEDPETMQAQWAEDGDISHVFFGYLIDAAYAYHGHLFISCGARIMWSEGDENKPPNKWEWEYADLPTVDACREFVEGEGKLYWVGSDEVWRIDAREDELKWQFSMVAKGEYLVMAAHPKSYLAQMTRRKQEAM